jgi:endonuclease/exonuclease/phosphatase family metal-dependent hydrolase
MEESGLTRAKAFARMEAAHRVNPAVESTIKLLSLNLAHARKDGWQQLFMQPATIHANLDAVAQLLRREAPDVVALQEADSRSLWSGRFHHVKHLTEQAGMPYLAHGKHVGWLGLRCDTALLSRLPLGDPLLHAFEAGPLTLPKGMVLCTLGWPESGGRQVDIASLHLDCLRKAARRRQAGEIVDRIANRNRPLVLAGDFNCHLGNEEATLPYLFEELNLRAYRPDAGNLSTFPSRGKRLDWILVSPEIEFAGYRTLPDVVSDHRAVIATLRLAE